MRPSPGALLLGTYQVPRSASYNVAIGACAAAREPAAALRLLREMADEGHRRSVLSYNAALRAIAPSGRWRQALALLGQMQEEKARRPLADARATDLPPRSDRHLARSRARSRRCARRCSRSTSPSTRAPRELRATSPWT